MVKIGTYWVTKLAWTEVASGLVLVVVDESVTPCEYLMLGQW